MYRTGMYGEARDSLLLFVEDASRTSCLVFACALFAQQKLKVAQRSYTFCRHGCSLEIVCGFLVAASLGSLVCFTVVWEVEWLEA